MPKSGAAGSYGDRMFTLINNGQTFREWLYYFKCLLARMSNLISLHLCQNLLSCISDNSLSSRYEVLSHHGFDLNFPEGHMQQCSAHQDTSFLGLLASWILLLFLCCFLGRDGISCHPSQSQALSLDSLDSSFNNQLLPRVHGS